MKRTTVLLVALALTGGVAQTMADVDPSKLPPPAKKDGVTFASDIQPFFKASCVGCHGAEKPKGGLRLDTVEGVLKGSKEGKVVTPGDSGKSLLVHAISRLDPDLAMPPKPKARKPGEPEKQGPPPPKPLTPEQVGLVRAWIDQGAK